MNAFQAADTYISLKRRMFPPGISGWIVLFNELLLLPMIALIFFLCDPTQTVLSLLAPCMSASNAWRDWEQFHALEDRMIRMFVYMMATGGPQITTNDPTYIPYVFAYAVTRQHPQHMEWHRRVRQHLAL